MRNLKLLSPAAQTILVAICGLMACGALLGAEALRGLQGLMQFGGHTSGEWIAVGAAALGAFISCALMRDWFGQSGALGIAYALSGVFIMTMLLGVTTGTFLLPVLGTMFGPWLIVATIITRPWFLLPWLISLLGFHKAMAEYRHERDSIFRTPPRDDLT